jgi:hypothetical protein
VTTPGTGNTSNPVTFTAFALAPLISTIAPTTATANTTVPVTLTGQGFTGVTSVNTAPGGGITVSSFTVVSGSQINATFVIGLNGTTQQISVSGPNGASNAVTFGIVPTLTSIAPTSNPANLSVAVTLNGTSLTGATAINANPTGFTGITVTGLTVVSSTQITATFAIAANATQGNRPITVTTPGGTTNAVQFNVLPPPPTITSINSPFKRGQTNQGVTVQGTNFTAPITIANVQVFLNGGSLPISSFNVNTFQATSTTQLRWNWTVPAGFAASSANNVYTMTVTTPSGTSAPFPFTVQ